MKKISDEFDRALGCWAGSPIVRCQCGRVHYCDRTITEEERANLNSRVTGMAHAYVVDTENDSVGVALVNGVPHAWNCPCESLAKMEEFIWVNRDVITRYLRARIDAELKTATAQAERLKL